MPAGVPFNQREWEFGLFCGAQGSPQTFRSQIMLLLKLALCIRPVDPLRRGQRCAGGGA